MRREVPPLRIATLLLLLISLASPIFAEGVSGAPAASSACVQNPRLLLDTPPIIHHREGLERHQHWEILDEPTLWAESTPRLSHLEAWRSRIREKVSDTGAIALIRQNRSRYSWIENEYPLEKQINRQVEAGELGRHRPMSCFEAQLLDYHASQYPLFEQPSEFGAFLVKRQNGVSSRLRIYYATWGTATPPKADRVMKPIEKDLSSGWKLWGLVHNHTFQFDGERGMLAVAAPSGNDLGYFRNLQRQHGMEIAIVIDGFNAIELTTEDFFQIEGPP